MSKQLARSMSTSTGSAVVEDDKCVPLERRIAALAGRRHCVLSGRGSSALYLALQALNVSQGKVVLPDTCCPHPAWVPGYLGLEVLFCDIDLDTFSLCPRALEALLETHGDIVAVVVVHLYGTIAPLSPVCRLLAGRGIALIEDGAQAFGGRSPEGPVGSGGEFSVLSFGATKNIDAGWGGATLTDDDELHSRLLRGRVALPKRTHVVDRLEREYRDVYYRLIALRDINPAFDSAFALLPPSYRSMLLFGPQNGPVQRLSAELDAMNTTIGHRREIAALYREGLRHRWISHGTFDEGTVPWRYSVLIEGGRRDGVTRALRKEGLHASNWYPALHRWFSSPQGNGSTRGNRAFPNAERLEREVLNLWVCPRTSFHEAKRAIDVVLAHLDEPDRGIDHD